MVERLVAIENVARSTRVTRFETVRPQKRFHKVNAKQIAKRVMYVNRRQIVAFSARGVIYLRMERWQSGLMHRF